MSAEFDAVDALITPVERLVAGNASIADAMVGNNVSWAKKCLGFCTKGRSMKLFDMTGEVALITGSSRGIGKAIAEAMAAHGARVVISSRKQDACDTVAAELNAAHGAGTAIAVAANISSKEELRRLVDTTAATFGPLSALVCNAATNPYSRRRRSRMSSFARSSTIISSPTTG